MDVIQHGFIVVDSPRGNDATAKRDSWTSPFATVSRAFQAVRDYDTVLIYPGPYLEKPEEPVDIANQPGGGAALWLQNRRCVTVRGIGLPEIWFTAHGNGLTIDNCTDVRLEGVKFRGAGYLCEAKPYYFALVLCHGVNEALVIRDCVFCESGNHGLAHLLGPRTTNNSVIENNRFRDGGHMRHPTLWRDGAAIALGGSGNVIRGNRIERWLRGMEYESGDFPGLNEPTARNIFSHNQLLQCWWQHLVITPTHSQAALFDQMLIEGNILQGWGAEPEQEFDPESSFGHEGIYFAGGVNAQIRGNDISDMWDGCGIRMTADWSDIQDVLVSENRIRNVGRTGIHAQGNPGGLSLEAAKVQVTQADRKGEIKLSVTGTANQVARIQRRRSVREGWSDWTKVRLTGAPVEFVSEPMEADGQCYYRAVLDSTNSPFNVRRCRFVRNKIGPCGGRGIWINGDYNAAESNDVHQCGRAPFWEGVYVEGGRRNTVRRNCLINTLPPADHGTETHLADNDYF